MSDFGQKFDMIALSDIDVQHINRFLCYRRLSLLQRDETHQFCSGRFFFFQKAKGIRTVCPSVFFFPPK
jgi:hypothetical protein